VDDFVEVNVSPGPSLNCYNDIATLMGDPTPDVKSDGRIVPAECLLVIDSGYSHTTITPLYKGRAIQQAVRRLDIGGRLLTNVLKDTLSIRQMDVRDETHMVNAMKEAACFVSPDFSRDLERTWKHGKHLSATDSPIVLDYVMPDYAATPRGFARAHDPALRKQTSRAGSATNARTGAPEFVATLGNERFAGPELLFHPPDLGVAQPGLPAAVMQSVRALPPGLWSAMLGNVLVVGGTAKLAGFVDRLRAELRPLVPLECVLRVRAAPDLVRSTWLGGARLAADAEAMREVLVSRQDYLEHGSGWLLKQFA